ncbi:MAG: hypothetical protein KDD19_28525 [Phaeodactylibacter sp.]|nr:hypothetical protein [Phaeodactylibacter sp.]MCB9048533.1 hypothetical protein [Lewinellaceae bacterium]
MSKTQGSTNIPIPEQLDELEARIAEAIDGAWGFTSPQEQLERIATAAATLCGSFGQVGEYAFERLTGQEADPEEQLFHSYLINYEWAAEAKAFLLLWRDVFFELQKGYLLMADGIIGESGMERLNQQSKAALQSAAKSLQGFMGRVKQSERKAWQPSRKRRIDNWRQQKNPWPVYREQFSSITGQMSRLLQQYQESANALAIFHKICHQAKQLVSTCQSDVLEVHNKIDQTTALLAEEDPGAGGLSNPVKISGRLEAIAGKVQAQPRLQAFSDALEEALNKLPEKMELALGIQGGMLEVLSLNLRKRCLQWLESEVLPPAYEAWELTENTLNGLKVALSNIRNRLILLSSESKETEGKWEMADLFQPIEAFRNNLLSSEEQLTGLAGTVKQRLESDFRFSTVFDSTHLFLPIPSQSAISRLRLRRYKWLDNLQRWWANQVKAVRKIRKAAEQEENLSTSEKVVRFIQSRTVSNDNSQYAAIFQAKGYIGESFWVGREDKMQHIESIIDNWKKGFRGAVAITGKRFSGKSFFGEMVANRFFPENTIRISPGCVIQIQGRKLEVDYNLEEALEFIQKNSLHEHPLLWIDGLESWWNPSVPLNQNVRALRRYIDAYSGNLFFLVSLSNALSNHLQQLHNVGSLFQAELNMDLMPAEAVREAILIRHGATHMTLLNDQLQEASPQQFNRLASRVHRAANGNIGEALLRWALSVQKVDENSVFIHTPPEYALPDFLNPDTAVLLSAILMQKRTSEYQLRKLMGPPFSEKYVNILRRLLSVGLLTRHSDGWLEINEGAANAIGALLEHKDYIKYEQWKQ